MIKLDAMLIFDNNIDDILSTIPAVVLNKLNIIYYNIDRIVEIVATIQSKELELVIFDINLNDPKKLDEFLLIKSIIVNIPTIIIEDIPSIAFSMTMSAGVQVCNRSKLCVSRAIIKAIIHQSKIDIQQTVESTNQSVIKIQKLG